MNVYMLHEIRLLTYTAVVYIKGEGAWCPVCARFGLGQYRLRVTSTHGDGLRYATCDNCKFSFKTIEETSKATEIIDPPATATYSKGRKQRRK